MLIYATTQQLTAWGTTPPANAASLLRSASLLITDQISSSVYAIDGTGLPSDPAQVQALADAACAQVTTWVSLGIDPAAGQAGVALPAAAKKVGSASISRSQTAAQVQARMNAADTLCDEAILLLRSAGLLSTRVWTY